MKRTGLGLLALIIIAWLAGATSVSGQSVPVYIIDANYSTPGRDCSLIGTWTAANSTCTLTKDFSGMVQIASDNTTLDGQYGSIGKHLIQSGGITVTGRTGVTIRNVVVKYAAVSGITLTNSSNSTIQNSDVAQVTLNGISLTGSSHNVITGNTASANVSGAGIYLEAGSVGNSLTGNHANLNKTGIYILGSDGNTISGNVASNNKSDYGIIVKSSQNTVITGNTASNNLDTGIYVAGSTGTTVSGNTTNSNTQAGISLSNSASTSLTGNIITNNGANGILLQGSNSNTISGNTIGPNASNGITFFASNNNTVYNNDFIGNAVQAEDDGATVPNVYNMPKPVGGNYWSNYNLSNGCTDANLDAFCDAPYPIATKGGAPPQDNLPWTVKDGWLDKTPPTTTVSLAGTQGSNGWYRSAVTVTLTADDGPTGTGVARTEYSYDNATWTAYSGPFSTATEGALTLWYRSVDKVGNVEAAKSIPMKVDSQPPNVTVTPSRPSDSNGWYNHPLTMTFSGVDATSGLAGCSPAQSYSGPDNPAVSVAGSCTDQAGNVGTASFAFKYDATPPVVAVTRVPSPNFAGWNNTPVAVHFAATDALSGVQGASSFDVSFAQEGANQSASHSFTDVAGNTASATVSVNIDKTPPVTTASLSGVPDGNGYYHAPVSVTLSAADQGGSGVSRTEYSFDNINWTQYTVPFTITKEGTVTLYYRSADNAGNLETAKSVTVKLDLEPPTTSVSLSGTPGNNGWYRSAVQATLTAVDHGGTGIAKTEYSFDNLAWTTYTGPFVISTEGLTTLYYRSTSNAGNAETAKSTQVKIDTVPPTVTAVPSRPADSNGWYNHSVSFTFSGVDATSGVAGCSSAQTYSGPDSATASVSGNCTDQAGNVGTVVFTFEYDATPPIVTVTTDPQPNAAGWNNTNVKAHFAATDAVSGIPGVSFFDVFFTQEGTGQTASRSFTDAAGNTASASVTVNIDKTPPEAYIQLDWSGKDAAVFGRDALSGVASGPVAPSSMVPTKWGGDDDARDGAHKDDNKDAKGDAQLRTYKIVDLAGNQLVLVDKVKLDGHSIRVVVVSAKYNGGATVTFDDNKVKFEWSANKDGSVNELEQDIEVGKGKGEQDVEAKYNDEKNQTTIDVDGPRSDTKIVKGGVVLLRLATSEGGLNIEY